MTTKYTGWRKSPNSQPEDHCVELARSAEGTIGVRDTKGRGQGPILEFTRSEWVAFVAKLQR